MMICRDAHIKPTNRRLAVSWHHRLYVLMMCMMWLMANNNTEIIVGSKLTLSIAVEIVSLGILLLGDSGEDKFTVC